MIDLTTMELYGEMKATAETVALYLLDYGIKINYKFVLPDMIIFYTDDFNSTISQNFILKNGIKDYEVANWIYDAINEEF